MLGRPPLYKEAAEMETKIEAYFIACDSAKRPYTITGLARALGLNSRQALLNYEGKPAFLDTVKKAKLRCQEYSEECLYTNRQVAGVIFNLKNNYGWVDKQEVEHSGSLSYELTLPEGLE